MRRFPETALKKLAIAAFYLALWQGLASLVGRSLLLPGPFETIERLVALFSEGAAWAAAGMTLLRILSGYLLGIAAGVLLAWLTARSRLMDALLRPLRAVVKATPVTSFILLALLWLS